MSTEGDVVQQLVVDFCIEFGHSFAIDVEEIRAYARTEPITPTDSLNSSLMQCREDLEDFTQPAAKKVKPSKFHMLTEEKKLNVQLNRCRRRKNAAACRIVPPQEDNKIQVADISETSQRVSLQPTANANSMFH